MKTNKVAKTQREKQSKYMKKNDTAATFNS